MLNAKPAGWFSSNYHVERDGELMTTLAMKWSREGAKYELEGYEFLVRREGWGGMIGAFQLSTGDRVIAEVSRPNPFRRRFEIRFVAAGEEPALTLASASMFGRKYRVERAGAPIGEIRPQGFFSMKAVADLPDDVALPVQVFLLWLVVFNWRRDSRNNSG